MFLPRQFDSDLKNQRFVQFFFESLKRVDLIKAISAAGVVGWQHNFHGSFSAPAFEELDKWKGKAEAKLLKPCGAESKFVGHEISLPGPIGVDG